MTDVEERTVDEMRGQLNVGASFAAIMIAADVLERASFDDEDAATIRQMPAEIRLSTIARLLDATEGIRTELGEIDARILLLTAGTGSEPQA